MIIAVEITTFIKFRKSIITTTFYAVCKGGDSCCTRLDKCGEDEGDCDSDDECQYGLKCGEDNCSQKSGFLWEPTDDCCYKPGKNLFSFFHTMLHFT